MPTPTTMRYVAAREPGPPDVLALAETSVPKPRADEVLIEVAYAGINRPDLLQRAGAYPPPPDASPIIGLEVAGRIVATGEKVRDRRVGDVVCALTPGGGYAEYCTTPAAFCLPLPRGLSALEAAGLPENYFTVWNNVFDRVHLARGETILIHGGSGGIGLTAIQLAKAFGAKAIATVGSAEKAEFCRGIGADHVINYREQDFVAEVAVITSKRGVDVVLDIVGGDYFEKNLRCLALEGRLAIIAFLQGSRVTLDLSSRHAAPAHDHRIDASREHCSTQGGDRDLAAREGLAAVRVRQAEDSRAPGVPARRSGRRARTDGIRRAHREDHARGRACGGGLTRRQKANTWRARPRGRTPRRWRTSSLRCTATPRARRSLPRLRNAPWESSTA